MPLLDLQRRHYTIGRIRIGTSQPTSEGRKRPVKLTTFRFTTRSYQAAHSITELYGGEAVRWADGPTDDQWQVFTQVSEIAVSIPPGDAALSQWWELWSGGGCERRCDGATEQLTGQPCLCPRDLLARSEAAKVGRACKPTTRCSVILPDLPGLGVWRLDSHGFNAAVELGGTAEMLARARAQGVAIPAVLRLEQRSSVAGGKTRRFVVPVLDITMSMRAVLELPAGAPLKAQLPPAPGQRAIEAPKPRFHNVTSSEECARRIAEITDPRLLRELMDHARHQSWRDDHFPENPDDDASPQVPLVHLFHARDRELAGQARESARR